MTVTSDTLSQLKAPFDESHISWRVGQKTTDGSMGQALPFIDNRVIQFVLDSIVKPENWRNEYTEVLADGKLIAVRCALYIRVNGEWISKEDAAPLTVTNNLELAIKGVYSDAMKRAAVHWGIGRYLYEFRAPWVPLSEKGRLLSAPALPAHMLPEGATVRESPEANASAPAASAPRTPSKPAAATPAKAQAPVSEPEAPRAVKASTEATTGSDANASLPEGLTPDEVNLVNDLIVKLGKMSGAMIRSYVEGPKGQEKLSAAAREYVLSKVSAKEATEA
jgi:hypothetical protein